MPSESQPAQNANSVSTGHVPIHGTERHVARHVRMIGPADPNEKFNVTVVLRRRPDGPPIPAPEALAKVPAPQRHRMPEAEFAAKYGADAADIAAVVKFAAAAGLTVVETHAARRSVIVSGTAAQMEKAFGVELNHYERPAERRGRSRAGAEGAPAVERYRSHAGAVHAPEDVAPAIVTVFGLDSRKQAKRNSGDPPSTDNTVGANNLATLYNFPPVSATGQTIAVFSYGGNAFPPGSGYDTTPGPTNDFAQYYAILPAGFTVPQIIPVPAAAISSNFGPDLETTQDICISSTIAQGAVIAVYFLDFYGNWHDLLERMITPSAGDLPAGVAAPSVISCSDYFADGDDSGTLSNEEVPTSEITAVHMAFEDAMTNHITVCIAAGDQGSDSKVGSEAGVTAWGYTFAPDGKAHVQYPGSDPLVLSCGGTTVGDVSGSSFDEYVWNDTHIEFSPTNWATGGGVSDFFTQAAGTAPAYQSSLSPQSVNDGHVGRGVPDIAGDASANSWTNCFVGGIPNVMNGTSAVAPLYAGLMALINAALGTRIGFINPILYQLGDAVCRDVNPAVGGGPANNSLNGIPGYTAGPGWDACTGWGSFDGIKLLNGLAQNLLAQDMQFWNEDSTFSADQVQDSPSYGNAFWLVLEGFTPNALGISAGNPSGTVSPSLSGAFLTLLGASNIVQAGSPLLELPSSYFTVQRIRYPYSITFPSGVPFPAAGNPPAFYELDASILVPGNSTPFSAHTVFELVGGANPYFANIDPSQNNVFWLSQDLRVFTITPTADNQTPIGTVPFTFTSGSPTVLDTQAAYNYIQGLVGYFNSTFSDGSVDPFAPTSTVLPNESGVYQGDSTVTPATPNPGNPSEPYNNYNFALARVRLRSPAGSAGGEADNVKVFFRIFGTQTNDTDYVNTSSALSLADPFITYPSNPAADPDDPATPLPGTNSTGTINGCTLPYFADPNELDLQPATMANPNPPYGVNNRTITIPTGSDTIWTYFGCFLNVYDNTVKFGGQTAQQWLAGGTHHCIVAQIAYSGAPIENTDGVVESPENSDKLAQRNLQITPSGNPGFPLSHRIPQTFDLRPSPPLAPEPGYLTNLPDELMIDWGDTPAGSAAAIYWPQLDADQVLQLAAQYRTALPFTKLDAHTIGCTVRGGITYLPIPTGTGENFAGLFTLDLPASIRIRDQFNIVVRRITSRQLLTQPVTFGAAQAAATGGRVLLNWRYVVGSFQVTVPVEKDEVILPQDENLLAILKWRLTILAPSSRWYPILLRYILYIEGRIIGMGGDPSKVLPSPLGTANQPIGQAGLPVPPPVHPAPGKGEFVGKVEGVIYDRFGDFEGFRLRTESGEEKHFRGKEPRVEKLVLEAWEDRMLILVSVDAHQHDWPARIILLRP
jgi:hypothetical protein